MHGDAGLAPAQDRIHAVEAVHRAAASARLALIAGHRGVVEIKAAGPLEQIASGRSHVAELSRGPSKNGARQQRIARLDALVVSEVAIRHERADAQTAGFSPLNLRKRQSGDVDQPSRTCHILLDQIDEIGAPGDESRIRVSADLFDGIADVARLDVIEINHCVDSGAAPRMTSSMAATMFG